MGAPHSDCCQWPRCKREYALTWLRRRLCGKHWHELCRLQDRGEYTKITRKLKVRLPA